jgi:hypothetical protein
MASETMGISMLVSIWADFRVVKTSQIVELLPSYMANCSFIPLKKLLNSMLRDL